MADKANDPVVFVRAAMTGTSGAKSFTGGSGQRLQLYIGGHTDERANGQLENLVAVLSDLLKHPKGAKLDIHFGTKQIEDRSFTSAFLYVKKVEEKSGGKSYENKVTTGRSTEAKVAAMNKESA